MVKTYLKFIINCDIYVRVPFLMSAHHQEKMDVKTHYPGR